MPVRVLPGPKIVGGHIYWETKLKINGWKIQYHEIDFFELGLKQYRLLDPDDHLIALAYNRKELEEYLDTLMKD